MLTNPMCVCVCVCMYVCVCVCMYVCMCVPLTVFSSPPPQRRYPKAKALFERASELLGYDLFKLCEEGPLEKLNQTEFAQPAIFVCSLAGSVSS
jgi:hypothetical protein